MAKILHFFWLFLALKEHVISFGTQQKKTATVSYNFSFALRILLRSQSRRLLFLAPTTVPTCLIDVFPTYSFRTAEEYLISKDEITCSLDAQTFKFIRSNRSPLVDNRVFVVNADSYWCDKEISC